MTNTRKEKNRGYRAVLVWGGIVRGRRTPLVRIEGRLCMVDYITQVLDKHVVPFISNKKNKVDILMHTMLHRIEQPYCQTISKLTWNSHNGLSISEPWSKPY